MSGKHISTGDGDGVEEVGKKTSTSVARIVFSNKITAKGVKADVAYKLSFDNYEYQIVSTRTVNAQYGQSVILSLQKADGSSCSAWACGVLTKGPETSKIGRV